MKSRAIWLVLAVSMVLVSTIDACMPSSSLLLTPPSTPAPFVVPSLSPQGGMSQPYSKTAQAVPLGATQTASQSLDLLAPQGCEVHIWHSFTGAKEAALQALAAAFEAQNSYNVRLRVEFHSPLHKEVLVSLHAGTPPDIVFASSDLIAEYAQTDAIVPLSDYIHSVKYGLSQAEQADLWPVVLEAMPVLTKAEQPLGVLFDAQAVVMFYNEGWLKKLKLDMPPQTWDEFAKACSTARDRKAGTWGYAFTANGSVLANWVLGLGGVLVNPKTHEPLLNSPEAVAAMSWLDDQVQKGYIHCSSEPGADRAEFTAEKALFAFGSTGELSMYTEAIASAKTKKPRFNWAIVPLPHSTQEPVVVIHGLIMSILRTTPRQQLAAWLFLKWLLRPESDAQWALATGALTLHKSCKDLPEMQAHFARNPQYDAACQLLAYAQAEPALLKWPDMRTLLANAASAICLGTANPAEGLLAADTAADALTQGQP